MINALEQALHERRLLQGGGLVHHSVRGSQYLALRYTERLAERVSSPRSAASATLATNALAETIDGLFKAEVIHRRGPWRSFEAVAFAPSNGSLDATPAARSNRSETCLLPRPRRATLLSPRCKPWPPDPNQTASAKPGAIHLSR